MSQFKPRSGSRATSTKNSLVNRKTRRSLFRPNRRFIFALAAATATPLVYAQTIWTGNSSNLWNDSGNWNPANVPGSGTVAEFASTSNNNNTVSLNGGTQAIGSMLFDSIPTSFSLGISAGDTFIFDSGGAITVNSDVAFGVSINAAIGTTGSMAINAFSNPGLGLSNITINNGGTLTVNLGSQTSTVITFEGQILDGTGGSASVAYLATNSASSDNNFDINGINTYSGGTTINAYTGNTGSFEIGSSSPFGTGTVTINSPNGSQFSAFGNGSQTISNAILLNGGMQFVGNNNLAINGPLQFLFNANNGLPTLSDHTASGTVISFGTVGGTSTITLGNPVSGGTSVSLVNVNTGTEIVINDKIVDPSATSHGNVEYGGQAGGIIQLNGPSTYAGQTIMNGNSTVQYSNSSTVNSGPFGVSTINFNNTANNQMQPIGGGTVTLSNPIQLTFGFSFSSAAGDTTSASLTGPLSLTTAGRTLTDNLTNGASLTLGAATNPSTLTLSTAVNANATFTGSGAFIINDVIQNNGTASNSITYTGIGSFTLNGQNTFSLGTLLTTNSSVQPTINIGANSTKSGSSIVSGPFGTGSLIFDTGGNSPAILVPVGADRTIANPIAIESGFWAASGTTAYNLTFTGPINVTAAAKTITNNMASGVALNFGTAVGSSTLSLNANNLIFQSQNGTAGGGVTVINDTIQGSGSITAQVGGTLYLNGQNTFTGGVYINNSTVVVSSDANLGGAAGAVFFGASPGMATLLSTGTFTSARNIDLGAGGTNIIDAASANTLTLTGPLTDTGDLTKGTSSGTVQLAQPGGVILANNVNVNGGLLVFGGNSTFSNTPNGPVVSGGGLSGPVNIGGTLAINPSARVAMNPSLPGNGQTNSIGSLSIGNGGVLDIGNHTVLVQNAPDETVIGKYLSNGYAGGFWNGTSSTGGAIQSIVAFNDNSGATSIGYGNSSDFTFGGSTSPYAAGSSRALVGNQVVVAPALAGDLLLEGKVGPGDLALLLGAFGTTGNDWAFGNIDYDAAGSVGPNDLSLLLSNFGHTSSGFAGAKTSAKSLTSTAKPSIVASTADTPAPPSDGVELIVNTLNGDVQLEGNNATALTSVVLTSPGNQLIGGTTFTPAFVALFNTSASNSNGLIDEFNTFANGSAVNGTVDMGDVWTVQNTGDIQFQFSEKGINRGGLQTGSVTYVGVPEPTTLSLLLVASAGLLGRRRRTSR